MSRLTRLDRLITAAGFGTLLMLCSNGCALAQAPAAQPPQNVESSIADLHRQLQITAAQEPQFTTVANVMRENARAETSAPQQPPANATAVDDLRAYIKYSEVELAGLKKMLPALDALYSALSPGQKKAADAVFRQGPGG
jgi:hypothetical protein